MASEYLHELSGCVRCLFMNTKSRTGIEQIIVSDTEYNVDGDEWVGEGGSTLKVLSWSHDVVTVQQCP